MAVADISLGRISLRVRPDEPFLLLKHIILLHTAATYSSYIQQLCEDTGCRLEDLPKAMNDREGWRERVRDIRASGTT